MAVLLSAMLLLFAGCGDSSDEGAGASEAAIAVATVNYNITSNTIVTRGAAGLTYRAEIETSGQWCSFALLSSGQAPVLEKSGDVGTPIFLYMQSNTTPDDRTATIRIRFSDDYTAILTCTQRGYTATADYDRSWGEQPWFAASDDYIYKTYYTTINGRTVRNYSVCFDRSKHVSNWVAYPVHALYTTFGGYQNKNSSGRTDAWAFDDTITEYADNSKGYVALGRTITQPEIPESEQQNILSTYGYNGMSRGHMLASATRLATWMTNAQTFYATNMMPQNSPFNSGSWATLESKERLWAGSGRNDTLWVVTGATFKSSETFSNNGNRVAVPSNCWKVMLRIRSGSGSKQLSECTADELKAIGFYYANAQSANSVSNRDAARSVKEIEQLTGFEFFRNLPEEIADQVKGSYDPSLWSGL